MIKKYPYLLITEVAGLMNVTSFTDVIAAEKHFDLDEK